MLSDNQADIYRELVERYESTLDENGNEPEYYDVDYFDDSDFDNGYCCWDIRYKGPKGYCHCKEFAEQQRKESLWYYRFAWKCAELYHTAIRKIKSVKLRKPKQTDDLDGLPF